jgi:lysophospholipase L1-like esterase
MPETRFARYVAIGDSQTEGLWDGDDSTGLLGFADRLAVMIDEHYPGLEYANLAIRGKRVRDVLDEQLPAAMSMNPDLISVCVGMNDVTQPNRKFHRALRQLEYLHWRLSISEATVVTTTFPDISRILPVGRFLANRLLEINEVIAAATYRYGFRVVDLYNAESMMGPDIWASDRVHGSTYGHELFAAAAAEVLGLPSGNHDWAHATGPVDQPFSARAYSQMLWSKNMLGPWFWRHLRGRRIGAGRVPKRPDLKRVRPDNAD